jgi:hypothetical protein
VGFKKIEFNRNAVIHETTELFTFADRYQAENKQEDESVLYTPACDPSTTFTTHRKTQSAKFTQCPLQRTLKLVNPVAAALWPAASLPLP